MTIAFDLDDVLADTITAANSWFNQTYGTNYQVSEYVSPRYNAIWNRANINAEDVWDNYVQSPIFQGLTPLPQSSEVVAELAKNHELHVITSRNSNLESFTKEWVARYFPDVFTTVTLTNHNWSHNGKQQLTKLDVCRQLGADVIVEDNPDFVREIVAAGIPVIMRLRPWNDFPDLTLNDMVFPFTDWETDFSDAFNRLQISRPV